MKSKVLKIVLTVVLLFAVLISLTACEDKDEKKSSKTKGGKDTAEEVIEAFIKASAKDKDDEAKSYVDYIAYIACEVLEDVDADFDEVYNFIVDSEKGLDYLEKHYEDLIEKFEDADIPVDEDTVDSIADLKDRMEDVVDDAIDHFEDYPNAKVKEIEEEDNYTDFDVDGLEFYRVTVELEEANEEEFDAWVMEIDGSYYILAMD